MVFGNRPSQAVWESRQNLNHEDTKARRHEKKSPTGEDLILKKALFFCALVTLSLGDKSCSMYMKLLILILLILVAPSVNAKTIYIHLIDGNDNTADGSYDRPFKSWRVALRQVTSGDTIVAKNGDYRKAGREAKWGGLDFILTMADQLDAKDPRSDNTARPDAVGIYRYDPKNPLTDRK